MTTLDLGSDLDLSLDLSVQPEPDSQLMWRANRLSNARPVEGGWPAVALLVGAADGGRWPWTVVGSLANERMFQVLGTAAEMILEVPPPGDGHRMVARVGDPGVPHRMPRECRFWARSFLSSEAWTAAEAAAIGWLRTGALDEGLLLKRTYTVPNSRNPL